MWKSSNGSKGLVFAVLLCCALWTAPTASAGEYLPPRGKVWAGLTGGTSITAWEQMVNHHPAVFDHYITWNSPTTWLTHADERLQTRLALSISTAPGYGQPGVVSTEGIARGRTDTYLVEMNQNLAAAHRIVYIRIMGEMNGYWNPYCPYNSNGSYRGNEESAHNYIAAWRRTVLILRGGPVSRIDRKLRALGLPRITAPLVRTAVLPRPKLAFLWVPQTEGSPDIPQLEPRHFWPGSAYVDWVGTDFFSKFPNWAWLDQFYKAFGGKPFVFSEWAVWGSDNPGFVRAMFDFVRSHSRVRMFNYYQGWTSRNPVLGDFDLANYPKSRALLRQQLASSRFPQYAPEYAP
jgi:hypothetical protein